MSSETELGSDVIVRWVTPVKRNCQATPVFVGMITNDWVILHVRCESLPQRWTSTFPGRMDVSTPGAFRYSRTLAKPTVDGISLNAEYFLVRELPSLEAEYPSGRRARHRAGGSGCRMRLRFRRFRVCPPNPSRVRTFRSPGHSRAPRFGS